MTLAAVHPIGPTKPDDDRSPAVGSRRWWLAVSALAGLVALSLALRLEGIRTWYWIDEALSVGIARNDLVDIPRLLLRDGSPPLWYLLLHGWTSAFGASVVATHALSVVFGVAVVPVTWACARRTFGSRAGWFAAVLVAVSPFVTYFGHETRMYALVVLLGVVVSWSFVSAFVDDDSAARWWFVGSLTALLYTHNWGLYTGVACAVALVPIWSVSTDRRALARRAGVAFGIVGLFYVPWVPALLSQIQNTGAPWSFTPTLRGIVTELAAIFRDERVLVALAVGVATGFASLARRWRSRDGLAVVTLGVLVVVPVAIGWTLSHLEPSWATRYLAVIVGPLLLLAGAGLARAGVSGIATTAVAAVLILQPLSRLDGLPMPRGAKSNARAVAAHVAPRLGPRDLVLVVQPEAVPLLALELGPGLRYADPSGIVAEPAVMDWRDAEERLKRSTFADDVAPLLDQLAVGGRLLLVLPGNPVRTTDTAWIELFRAKGRRIHQEMRRDRAFREIDGAYGSGAYITLRAVLFERVTPGG